MPTDPSWHRLSGKLNKLDQEKRNITGAVAYQFKCRKLEGRTKKLKEAVVFASKIAQMRVKAEGTHDDPCTGKHYH